MVKCVVSGCPNREVRIFNRAPRRFFSFPKDPARVKVWLAALRETDKQSWTEQHLICEDHFLPEDITADGVNRDAIPIMPPCLDGSLSMISSWGAESSDEEEQWAAGGGDDEEEEDTYEGVCAGFSNVVARVWDPPEPELPAPESPAPELPAPELPAPEPPAVDPSQQDSSPWKTSGTKTTSDGLQQRTDENWTETDTKKEVSMRALVKRFLEMMLTAPGGLLDVRQVVASLQTRRRRLNDVTNVLRGINLIDKPAAHLFTWTGESQISSFLWKNEQMFQRELDNMKLVEDTLDGLIKSCAQQLFDVTDDEENAAFAYVTHEDFSRLTVLQEQTLFVVKAPEETRLKVPAPKRDNIQIHLKAGKPITVLSCDVGMEDTTGETSDCFLTLEESRIKTATLHTESLGRQSAV
ncbi:transcription factor E2F3 isoform X1 [Larimichthys crocea]|uniref:transcription factor E2F3 isoform X1 n=1 Tax=Larimichthys crocea TaxID=215358 RepID=UPI000F602AC7|nr:transcription factor E2F3 isoform X1 [Larimichthys crocea]